MGSLDLQNRTHSNSMNRPIRPAQPLVQARRADIFVESQPQKNGKLRRERHLLRRFGVRRQLQRLPGNAAFERHPPLETNLSPDTQPHFKAVSQPPHSETFGGLADSLKPSPTHRDNVIAGALRRPPSIRSNPSAGAPAAAATASSTASPSTARLSSSASRGIVNGGAILTVCPQAPTGENIRTPL